MNYSRVISTNTNSSSTNSSSTNSSSFISSSTNSSSFNSSSFNSSSFNSYSIPIPIQKSPTNQVNSFSDTYILKQNSFDPMKNSPPNEFMSKLKSRMNTFYEK